MPFYIRPEKFCEDCGYPIDMCECFDDAEYFDDDDEVKDEDYL